MSATRYQSAAFFDSLTGVEAREDWYVCLVKEFTIYGGPEEGGWWRHGSTVEAWKLCPSKWEAEKLARKVQKRAEEMSAAAARAHGDQCLREMDWLEERGLEADFLPEPDGPESYRVIVSRGIPQDTLQPGGYE